MNRKTLCLLGSLCALLALYVDLQPARTQTSDFKAIPAEVQAMASQLLQSPVAEMISTSGLTALNLLSGHVSSPPWPGFERAFSAPVPPFSLGPGEVMVNDPTKDFLEVFDITTQSETAVAGFGDNIVVAYNNSRNFSGSLSLTGYSLSRDGGESFNDLGLIPGPALGRNLGDPALVADRNGNFYAAAIVSDFTRPRGFTSTIGISKSTDGGVRFNPPIAPEAPFGPPDTSHFADKEFIAVDTSGGRFDGNVYVSWTDFQFNNATFQSQAPIMFSRSTNGGASFTTPIQLSFGGSAEAVQGSEPAVGPNGEVYVAWFRWSPQPGGIYVTKSTNGGLSFGPRSLAAPAKWIGFGVPLRFIPQVAGNLRVNSFPRIDVDPESGNVYIVYAANASGAGGDSADIFFIRSTDGARTWSVPIRVNDDSTKNDQFFPDVAVSQDGTIEVIWYDRRLDPGNLRIDVFRAQSTDGGLSFGPNERVTSESFLPGVGYDPMINPVYMGDYIDVKVGTTPQGRGFKFLLAWGDCRRVITTPQGTRPDQDVLFTTN